MNKGADMKTKITNDHNLKDFEMKETIIRVKGLLINDKNEIMLGYSHNIYQFPGGHVECDEPLTEALEREIKEETGISLNLEGLEPFYEYIKYNKDWPVKGKRRLSKIYYFEVMTNSTINLNEVNYTDHEKQGNFELKYITLDTVEEELINNKNKYQEASGIAKEMLEAISVYKKN
jgi:ADP-ribose pyrophosphatase YjhB (NUDIX family)